MTLTLCTNCGFSPAEEGNTRPFPHGLRDRLSKLDTLIAVLTAERQKLQTESDAIVYPILSLAPEITTEIFLRCQGGETYSRPSPSKGPLLLTQICHHWRQIAIHTPELWRCPQFNTDSPSSVDLYTLWLDRSGDIPLGISMQSWETARACSMIEASMRHCHHWQDIKFDLPLTSYPTLDLVNAPLPMLRSITLTINQHGGDDTDGVIIRNAPSLRKANLGGVKIDIPWSQLTSLTLHGSVTVADCLTFLPGCKHLVKLVITLFSQTPPHTDFIVLPTLESFHSNSTAALILGHLTLPRLKRLVFNDYVQHQNVVALENLIHRSSCPLRALSIPGQNIALETFAACLTAVSNSVSDLDVHEISPGQLLLALEPTEILPHLTTLRMHFRNRRLLETDYRDVIDVVHARMSPSPPRVCLEGFTLYADLPTGFDPTVSTMARFRAFAAAGLKIKLTLPETRTRRQTTRSTHVAMDSWTD
ncbi:hypothetical protein B0H16DRAFT_1796822 [Mycena metata]|uniref:F-box domain-containing protein n=1 Tax=Mycena metata TaxID=1033252 RepID=A0AAD7JI75_9AGAR|nr:hypothetical protein B0H16DRAFT_1796822 [Mycena metata]